jgi:signal peptide peptidase SppA
MIRDSYWAIEPQAGARLLATFEKVRPELASGAGRKAGNSPPYIHHSAFPIQHSELGIQHPAFPIPHSDASAGPAEDAEGDLLPITVVGNVAVVHVQGPMIKRGGFVASLCGLSSTLRIRTAFEAAVADDAVAAIMLRIDSPGGSAEGLAELADAIFAARGVKPIVAQVDGMMASAAYLVGSQADAVYAQRMDLIGSIGTRLLLYDWSGYFEEAGVKAIPIDSAPADRPFKSAAAMGTPITEDQVADFQRIVDAFFADFRAAVLRGRGMSDAQFDAVADGRVWPAAEAQRLGLIDGIRTVEATLEELARTPAPSRSGRHDRHRINQMAMTTAMLNAEC